LNSGERRARESGQFSDDGADDALNDEVFAGVELGIGGVFGFEEPAVVVFDEAFEGVFAVDEGGDDLTGAGRGGGFDDDEIAVEDAGVFHGIAADFQDEAALAGAETEDRLVEEGGGIRRRGGDLLRRAGGDAAEDGERVESRRQNGVAAFADDVDGTGAAIGAADGAFDFEGMEVPGDTVGAADAEVALDLRDGWRAAVFAAEGEDEVEDFALPLGQFHSISIYSIGEDVKARD
jgi:hypothetical protein